MEVTDPAPHLARLRRRRRIFLIGAVLGGLAVLLWALAQPPSTWAALREAIAPVVGWVRGLGAGWYFVCFAVLPAFGFPVSAFAFSAGPLFGPVLGLPLVLTLSSLSMAASMSISYGLARHVLRPWVTRLLAFLGYTVPEVPREKHGIFTVLVRITPGPPYSLQNVLLGLVRVPFGLYFAVSWVVCSLNVILFIVFGDALARGQGRVALLALAGVVMVVTGVRIVRRRLAARARDLAEPAAGERGAGEGV